MYKPRDKDNIPWKFFSKIFSYLYIKCWSVEAVSGECYQSCYLRQMHLVVSLLVPCRTAGGVSPLLTGAGQVYRHMVYDLRIYPIIHRVLAAILLRTTQTAVSTTVAAVVATIAITATSSVFAASWLWLSFHCLFLFPHFYFSLFHTSINTYCLSLFHYVHYVHWFTYSITDFFTD